MNEKAEVIQCGKILGNADDPKSFAKLYDELMKLFADFPPAGVFCETQFVGVNKATSIKTIRPTGVVLAVTGRTEATFDFVEPSKWRKLFQGKGKWKKRDTFDFVKEHYPGFVKAFTRDNDIADAIGIACAAAIFYAEGTVHYAAELG